MEGVRYLTDENGKRVAVQLDLETYGELWEDIEDVIVAQSRANEETVSLDDFLGELEVDEKLSA